MNNQETDQEIVINNVTADNQYYYLDRAIQYYERGLIIKSLKWFELLVSKYKNIHALDYLVNHYISVKNINKLLNLLPLLKSNCLERTTNNIAEIYFLAKDYEKALEYSLKGRSLHLIDNYIIGICYNKLSKVKNLSTVINTIYNSRENLQELSKMFERKTKYLDLAIEYLTKCCHDVNFKHFCNTCYYLGYCYLRKNNIFKASEFLQFALNMGEIRAASLLGYIFALRQDEINSNYYFSIAKKYSFTVKAYKHFVKRLKLSKNTPEVGHAYVSLLRLIKEKIKTCNTESKNNKLRYIYEKYQKELKDMLINLEINIQILIDQEFEYVDDLNSEFAILQSISQEYLNY